MAPLTIKIRVLLLRDRDSWVAQCLEYDIVTQAKTLPGVETSLRRVLAGELALSLDRGPKPFGGIRPAPKRFVEMYEGSRRVEAGFKTIAMPKDHMARSVRVKSDEIRVH